ncbi:protein kinase domain-containing protein [Modestobacter sp. URMC 112]
MTDPAPGNGPDRPTFGRYRLAEPLAGPGTQLLRAHDVEDGRDVTLRVLPVEEPGEGRRERFLREMPVVRRLTEPHLVPVLRYGEVGGRLFVAMPLVQGEHLSAVLARTGPLDPARAVDLVGQLARALDAAHAAGLVHGDVSSSSVLVAARADGRDVADSAAGEDAVLLADLGVAPAPGQGPTGPPSSAGATPDAGIDVQGLAGLLYELLTGRRPAAAPGPPSVLRPGLPPELDAVVLRGLAEDPGQRWRSAGGMAAGARAALALGGVEVSRPAELPGSGPATDPAGPSRTRRPAGAASVGAAVLAVLGIAALARRRRTGSRRRGGRRLR